MIEKYMTFSVSATQKCCNANTIKIRNLKIDNLKQLINSEKINDNSNIIIDYAVTDLIAFLFEKNDIKNKLKEMNSIKNIDWIMFFQKPQNYQLLEKIDCTNKEEVEGKGWKQWKWPSEFTREEFIKVCFYYGEYIHPLIKNLDFLQLTGHIDFDKLNNKEEIGLKPAKDEIFDKINETSKKLEELIQVYC